jgi:5-methylcytosine-specific restriction endonuclease McrA
MRMGVKCGRIRGRNINMQQPVRKIVEGIPYKRCSKCHQWLTYDKYAKSQANSVDGLLDQCRECRHQHYVQHRNTYINRAKQYKKDHPQETAQYRKDYLITHPDKLNIWHTTYRRKFPEIKSFHNRQTNYKRRLNIAEDKITSQEWLELCQLLEYHCAYCDEVIPFNKLTMDHIIPLSRGGKHCITNILPACNSCNCSKGSKTLEEFLQLRGESLE